MTRMGVQTMRKVQIFLRCQAFTAVGIIFITVILFTKYYKPSIKKNLLDEKEFVISKKPKNQPHIILMVADDLGYNDVSYHGSEIRTPNIDWLATSGIRLENYYVQPICTQTRSQILTGRYQIHTGLQHGVIHPADRRGLPLDSPTLADKLKEVGYSTHIVGKWNLGFSRKEYMPTYRGFDSFFGYLCGYKDYYTHEVGYMQWSGYDLRENEQPADIRKYYGNYSQHLFAEKAVDILKAHNTSKPLFLYLPFQAPHRPYQIPKSYVKPYKETVQNTLRRTFAGLVSCMDEAVGNITQALKQLGYWQNSVIIFTTDNGADEKSGGNNLPLRGYKGQYFEGGLRAVGFIYSTWLQKTLGGTVSNDLIHVSDWFPTLLNIAGGSTDGTKPLDGFDQWETIAKGKPSKRTEILFNIDPLEKEEGQPLFNYTFDTRISAALRMDDWKLITGYSEKRFNQSANKYKSRLNGFENVWLFNIKNDPYEKHEISEKHPDVLQIMLARLEDYHQTSVPVMDEINDPAANPELHGGFWGPWL